MKLSVVKPIAVAARAADVEPYPSLPVVGAPLLPRRGPLQTLRVLPSHAEGDSADDEARARRAVEVVLRSLARLGRSAEACRLAVEAERLLVEVAGWHDSPPAQERREEVARTTLSIHLRALRAISEGEGR